jgi:hypothetical protein
MVLVGLKLKVHIPDERTMKGYEPIFVPPERPRVAGCFDTNLFSLHP